MNAILVQATVRIQAYCTWSDATKLLILYLYSCSLVTAAVVVHAVLYLKYLKQTVFNKKKTKKMCLKLEKQPLYNKIYTVW